MAIIKPEDFILIKSVFRVDTGSFIMPLTTKIQLAP
jgi:hypothetical protein